jgi:hypothetical protein
MAYLMLTMALTGCSSAELSEFFIPKRLETKVHWQNSQPENLERFKLPDHVDLYEILNRLQ